MVQRARPACQVSEVTFLVNDRRSTSEESPNALFDAFKNTASDNSIVNARFEVLDQAEDTLTTIAMYWQSLCLLRPDNRDLAVALLVRIAAELSGGISLLLRNSRTYGAGALVRQLIEVEYLMYLGSSDPANLERWYEADARELRESFSPQRMRNAAEGLFSDNEYWLHCELGGHPHRTSRVLIFNDEQIGEPLAFLLPDAVQHIRRLWTWLKQLLSKLDFGEFISQRFVAPLDETMARWMRVEDPLILSADGIQEGGSGQL